MKDKLAGFYVEDVGDLLKEIYDVFGVTISFSGDTMLQSDYKNMTSARDEITQQIRWHIEKAFKEKLDSMIGSVSKRAELTSIRALSLTGG